MRTNEFVPFGDNRPTGKCPECGTEKRLTFSHYDKDGMMWHLGSVHCIPWAYVNKRMTNILLMRSGNTSMEHALC